jgi:hypothetical protein
MNIADRAADCSSSSTSTLAPSGQLIKYKGITLLFVQEKSLLIEKVVFSAVSHFTDLLSLSSEMFPHKACLL